MKVILEHVKAQTVPHDMLDELFQANVPFYDGTDVPCSKHFRHYTNA